MDTTEALQRVRLITPMLQKDVQTAILSHAVMEAANETVPKGMKGVNSSFVMPYDAVQNALSLKLAMDIARIFDISKGRPPEQQDKASIQVLAALLQVSGVQQALEDDAATWYPSSAHIVTVGTAPAGLQEEIIKSLEEDCRSESRQECRRALGDFLAVAAKLDVQGSPEFGALTRIREFRDRRLAHSLFNKEPDELPRYSDLHLLLGAAKQAARHALLAVEGLNIDLEEQAQRDRDNAEGYSACVLDGLSRAAAMEGDTAVVEGDFAAPAGPAEGGQKNF